GGGGGFGLANLNLNMGQARRSQAGVTLSADEYPAPWSPPMLAELPQITLVEAAAQPKKDDDEQPTREPPLVLPPWFGETS
ncbi:hypothetical protein, partial [Bradyrhizobium neotropicale]|uniref:hypothetical protein n=1 Tax=Bradyrhizobium neotropicale TaxID=1497615 RepID=UPI001AD70C9F